MLHNHLAPSRVNKKREFFQISLKEAIRLLSKVAREVIAHQEGGPKLIEKVLAAYLDATEKTDYEARSKALVELRTLSLTSNEARDKLRELVYSDDGNLRILAAESLSITKSYPQDAIPVLQTVLDVAREGQSWENSEQWARISLGALARYGETGLEAEKSVWPYLYAQDDINLQLYAVRVVSKLAKVSESSWTILCLLCRHENEVIREFTKDIMQSEEFSLHIRGKEREHDNGHECA